MRLICPNCAAQYEVDVSMVPPEGRDVQCSSCGHAWFQRRQSSAENIADAEGVSEPAPGRATASRTARDESAFAEDETDAAEDRAAAPPAPAEPPVPEGPKPRPLDETARTVLREEALREAEARRRDSPSAMETQPDLGLEEGGRRGARTAPDRASKAASAPAETDAEDSTDQEISQAMSAAAGGSRGSFLPDIEEINSTLTATSDRQNSDPHDQEDEIFEERRTAFRIGFLGVLSLLVVLVLLYVLGPAIARSVPALAPLIGGYLDMVTDFLNAIDEGMQHLVAWLNGLIGGEAL